MCICGGLEVVVATAIGGYIVKKKMTIRLPPLAEAVAGMRAGVRPGQLFKDKRDKARVNARVKARQDAASDSGR